MTDSKALRDTAHRAALAAGAVIAENYDKPRQVHFKAPGDLVTDTDREAQAAAIAVIREVFPDHSILAEEDEPQAADGYWPIPDGVTWVIDPLDGTTNYTNRVPFVCTSVGVAVNGEPVAGAVYDPLRAEMFLAGRGLGATLNDRSLPDLASVDLRDSLICLDWAHDPTIPYNVRDVAAAIAPRARTTRALGAAALALAYVACGRVQIYTNLGLKPWDVAAAAAIIGEVGGDLRLLDGSGAWSLGHPALIAGHPALLDEALALFEEKTL